MAISAQAVKQLKELTNCGMMDCKRALEETNGDVDAAIKNLREKGLAKAAKEVRQNCCRRSCIYKDRRG